MNSYKIIVIDNTRGLEAWSADIMANTPRGSVMALAARLESTTHTAPVVKPAAIVEPSKGSQAVRPDSLRPSEHWLYAPTETIQAIPVNACDDGMLAPRLSVPIIPKRKPRHRKER